MSKATGMLIAIPFIVGALLGGLGGALRFDNVQQDRQLCVSCHHEAANGTEGAMDREPVHSSELEGECHTCHVLPVREYLSYGASRLHVSAPEWVQDMRNPTIGGQTCMECHLARGRGVIDCERCHTDGTRNADLTLDCNACHRGHDPLPPHDSVSCRDCHVEAFVGHHQRVEAVMNDKLGTNTENTEP